eukprot:TRINITY_DN12817_c0_g1_i2.p1 TRINITY_DN12817_c0_g1~~TRINITY_DN12817_c0_g1_i2.p1  ORF type:complete len:483 (+),score=84.64 TRINITY_DN12817_c0_g1_i2:25-1473(+)
MDQPLPQQSLRWAELRHRLPLQCAFALFGLGSWIAVNGVYQELPLIAQSAPEGYDIFSYATLTIAIANVFPVGYLSLVCNLTTNGRARADKVSIVAVVGAGGVLTCALLAGYWDHTTVLFGEERSVPLIVLVFFAGGIDCLTSVLFYPVLVGFPNESVAALQFGETLTGLVSAVLAAIQTACPRFTVSGFFISMAALMGCSMVGYKYIERARPAAQLKEHAQLVDERKVSIASDASTPKSGHEGKSLTRLSVSPMHEEEHNVMLQPEDPEEEYAGAQETDAAQVERAGLEWELLAAQAVLSFLENGVHTTILPHSLMLYPDSDMLISVSVKLGFGLAALATIVAHFRQPALEDWWVWGLLYMVCYALGVWMIVAASVEVHAGVQGWGVLTVMVIVTCKVTVTYTKTCLFIQAQRANNPEQALRFSGVGVQIGSLVGAVLFFLLTAVSYTHLRAHETVLDLVCRLLLEKKKQNAINKGMWYET